LFIQAAIDAASNYTSSESTTDDDVDLIALVYVPTGEFESGQLNFTHARDLYLCFESPKASIRSIYNASLYPCIPSVTADTGICDYPFVFFFNCTRCGLIAPEGVSSGRVENFSNASNTIDLDLNLNGGLNDPPGNGISAYDEQTNMLMPIEWDLPLCSFFSCRPKLMVVSHCESFTIYGVSIGNSAFWTLELVQTRSVLIESSVIAGDRRYPNNDGIDVIDSSEVVIRNTTISTGDDCIAIITHTSSPIESIVGTNLTLSSTSAAIKLASYGVNATGLISDVFFSQSTI